jgi:glyoxylase-like metal-dependent hydrolase (beta-lactamase superfamily II)
VVVVDTNLLVSDIAALTARLAALHKPLLGVFITHAHPDHFNGALELVRDREVPVYATSGVVRVIHQIADAKRAQWRPVYGAEWPTETYYPNTELGDGQQVNIDGLAVTARELGPGESHADSWLLVQPADGATAPLAFTGDLVFHRTHPYTADGHTGAWLATLDRLATELARSGVGRLLPGHGAPSGPGLLAEQRRYLLFYREVVGAPGRGCRHAQRRGQAGSGGDDAALPAGCPADLDDRVGRRWVRAGSPRPEERWWRSRGATTPRRPGRPGVAPEALARHAAIAGSTSAVVHLEENLAASALRLDDDEFQLLGST